MENDLNYPGVGRCKCLISIYFAVHPLQLNEAGDKIINAKEFLKGRYARLHDVGVAPDGTVYVSPIKGSNEKIIKITACK